MNNNSLKLFTVYNFRERKNFAKTSSESAFNRRSWLLNKVIKVFFYLA